MGTIMMNWKKVVWRTAYIALIIILVLVGVKFYEKNRPASDYFEYYGDVTTKLEYRAPEKIESIAFGVNVNNEAPDIYFENQLWCSPLEYPSRAKILISEAGSLATDYVYWNNIDVNLMSRSLLNGQRIQVFSKELADNIRKKASNGEYGTWGLNNQYPDRDSVCRIVATGTVRSLLFNYPKVQVSIGNDFTYYAE